jgi:hypothetical protein
LNNPFANIALEKTTKGRIKLNIISFSLLTVEPCITFLASIQAWIKWEFMAIAIPKGLLHRKATNKIRKDSQIIWLKPQIVVLKI